MLRRRRKVCEKYQVFPLRFPLEQWFILWGGDRAPRDREMDIEINIF